MRVIRVALASPSDVAQERTKVEGLISEINPLLVRELDLAMVLSRWENLPPEFNEGGPQAIIDQALAFERADLFIGIFANRLGTTSPDGQTGSEHEFGIAYSAWLARGRPEIMLYFKRTPSGSHPGKMASRPDLMKEFKIELAKRYNALWREYDDVFDFERMLRLALIEYALREFRSSKPFAPHPPNICWFLKFIPSKPGLADLAVRDEVMKDLQEKSGDNFLRLRDVALESNSLTVEGKLEGYATLKQQFNVRSIRNVGSLKIRDVWRLDLSSTDLVQPLYRADSHLLQVLVRKFELSRLGQGIHVQLEFDRNSPAIWRREARAAVRRHLTDEQKQECQTAIDKVIEGSEDTLVFANSDFPFRHANGGVLPIIQIEDKRYYCLFYRETDPIGWNIANGGSDDSDELIDPRKTILRELREELIMLGPPPTKKRYTFVKDDKDVHNRPEYLKALNLWKSIVGNWPSLDRRRRDIDADIKWESAPDSMTILPGDYGVSKPDPVVDIYVNITAEDCAIEVDRVAIITAPAEFRLLDGEVYGGTLVNRPIGLFEIGRFKAIEDLGTPEKNFEPDEVFYDGARTKKDLLFSELLAKHMARQKNVGLVTEEQLAMWQVEPNQLKLCPITRSIISRRIRGAATLA